MLKCHCGSDFRIHTVKLLESLKVCSYLIFGSIWILLKRQCRLGVYDEKDGLDQLV